MYLQISTISGIGDESWNRFFSTRHHIHCRNGKDTDSVAELELAER